MLIVLMVGAGGLVGSVLRYLIGRGLHEVLGNPWFPYGTLTVNILGCLLIGLVTGVADNRHMLSPEVRALLLVGLLGGGHHLLGLRRASPPTAPGWRSR